MCLHVNSYANVWLVTWTQFGTCSRAKGSLLCSGKHRADSYTQERNKGAARVKPWCWRWLSAITLHVMKLITTCVAFEIICYSCHVLGQYELCWRENSRPSWWCWTYYGALGGRIISLCTFTLRHEEDAEAEETWHINSKGGRKEETR